MKQACKVPEEKANENTHGATETRTTKKGSHETMQGKQLELPMIDIT